MPPANPAPFLLCFEAHNAKHGRVWAVKQGVRWRMAAEVRIHVPIFTKYLGAEAKQPKAYLEGVGVVRTLQRGIIEITQ